MKGTHIGTSTYERYAQRNKTKSIYVNTEEYLFIYKFNLLYVNTEEYLFIYKFNLLSKRLSLDELDH